jgi:hypothetical protein
MASSAAAALMLRQSGIPTRYAKGFAVMEHDARRGEWVIRGTHGHAWCRVWDEETSTWLDFDPTPANWLAATTQKPSWTQAFNDGLKRIREDFFIWRSEPGNRLGVSLAMLAVGLALIAFIAKRLWRSKRRIEQKILAAGYEGPVVHTPLHDLEPLARKRLGPRSPGQPFGTWLARLRTFLPESPELDEAISLHQRIRFDPVPPPPAVQERLADLTQKILGRLKDA